MTEKLPGKSNQQSWIAIVIIVVGAIFLLQSLNIMHLGHFIGEWWPLILIIGGFSKLQADDRFVIHFTDKSIATDINDVSVSVKDESGIDISKDGSYALVTVDRNLLVHKGQVAVYNLSGELIATCEIEGELTQIALPEQTGLYLVKARFGNHVVTEKLLVGQEI